MTQVTSPRGRSLRSRGPVAHVGRLTAVAPGPTPRISDMSVFPPARPARLPAVARETP